MGHSRRFWCADVSFLFRAVLSPHKRGLREGQGIVYCQHDQSVIVGDRCIITVLLPSLTRLCLQVWREDKRWGDTPIRRWPLFLFFPSCLTLDAHHTSHRLDSTPQYMACLRPGILQLLLPLLLAQRENNSAPPIPPFQGLTQAKTGVAVKMGVLKVIFMWVVCLGLG